jgi:DNA-binding beta-propeller fold protein YncE
MRGPTLALLAVLAGSGCSSLSDRDLLHHAGAFSVIPIQLSTLDHEPIQASKVTVDPINRAVYVAGDDSSDIALVDGRSAHLVGYASVRPLGERGGPPEGLIASPGGNEIFVRLPDFDGVPVMVHIGDEPSHVIHGDPVQVSAAAAGELPRRLMSFSVEAGQLLLADMAPDGATEFQCLKIRNDATMICPEPLDELPVDLVLDAARDRVLVLSAPDAYYSRLHAYDASGEVWSRTFPGGPVQGKLLVDEGDGSVYVAQQNMGTLIRFGADGEGPTLLPVESGPVDMVQDHDSGLVYVACRDAHSLVVVDPVAGETYSMPLGESPVAIAIDDQAGYLFVALREGRSMAVIDLYRHELAHVDVTGPQLDVAVDPGVDGGYAYAVVDGEILARMAY